MPAGARPRHALFPGTFDPPTLGHEDLIRRARALFERVTVGLAVHPTKASLFSVEERLDLLRRLTAGQPGVAVERVDGLVVDACERLGCDVLVRGVRSGTDFDYEVTMARSNRALRPRVDTVLLVPDGPIEHVTGTIVRQVAALGGDVRSFVSPLVADALRSRFARGPA